jgi:hypothetical protein
VLIKLVVEVSLQLKRKNVRSKNRIQEIGKPCKGKPHKKASSMRNHFNKLHKKATLLDKDFIVKRVKRDKFPLSEFSYLLGGFQINVLFFIFFSFFEIRLQNNILGEMDRA